MSAIEIFVTYAMNRPQTKVKSFWAPYVIFLFMLSWLHTLYAVDAKLYYYLILKLRLHETKKNCDTMAIISRLVEQETFFSLVIKVLSHIAISIIGHQIISKLGRKFSNIVSVMSRMMEKIMLHFRSWHWWTLMLCHCAIGNERGFQHHFTIEAFVVNYWTILAELSHARENISLN